MEAWKDIKGWEGKYSVSDQGRVLSLRGDWTMLKPVIRAGYPSVTLSGSGALQHYTIHRLVMDTFDENQMGLREVDHVYGDKSDARLGSLERVTSSENKKRAYRLGLMDRRGEKHHLSRLVNDQVLYIFNSNLSYRELALKHGVTTAHISMIKTGKQWAHITGKIWQAKEIRRLTPKEVLDIYNDHGTYRELGEKYNVSFSVVESIKNKKSHSKILYNL